jgi:hypothetical protein
MCGVIKHLACMRKEIEMLTGLWCENLKQMGHLKDLTYTWKDINMDLKEEG